MKEFQKLYHRVIDYRPPEDLQIKISLLLRKIELKHAQQIMDDQAKQGRRLHHVRFGTLSRLFRRDPNAEKMSLIKIITDEEELSNFSSPQGLLINGEVGCGKSMLMDIFASSLPHQSKMRWHFNNFILWVYNEIHSIQNEKILTANLHGYHSRLSMENEFILFEIAQKMINKNTILMLDEFMLPDIASANIIKILFTYYFKLGGVLVATSNKLPEELYSNEFHKSKFKTFVNILNYRCTSVDMRSSKDYRVQLSAQNLSDCNATVVWNNPNHTAEWNRLIKSKVLQIPHQSPLMAPEIAIADSRLGGIPGSFKVYSRVTHLPVTFSSRICYLDFDYICRGLYGSSDYITLASNYSTIVLTNVPILTTKMKNEARRFITLLDALYESKCQFYIKSEVPIDYTFFPDAQDSEAPEEIKQMVRDRNDNNLEVQDEEMFSKTSIATSSPYRPNVSTYDQNHTIEYRESQVSNYKDITAFTGEDEKFAYKRAVSRIKEMVGSTAWRQADRWVPIDDTMRPWEVTSNPTTTRDIHLQPQQLSPEAEEQVDEQIRELLHNKGKLISSLPRDIAGDMRMPFRMFNRKLAPIFSNIQHFWSMGQWNRSRKVKDEIARSWLNSTNMRD
ncbi:peroxisome-assembly ATPase [Yamadazyma tenuis]|nr:peroxisome-assembly ATPase [Yamadazyma tenuis]